MGANQNFFRNQSVGLYPENHHKPQNLDEVWSSYRRAKPTQISSRNKREKARKRSRKTADLAVRDRSDRSLWAVRPVGLDLKFQTGQTGCSDRSDRLHRPVRPVSATGQTASAQNRIPARELEVISRLLVQIITKWSQNL